VCGLPSAGRNIWIVRASDVSRKEQCGLGKSPGDPRDLVEAESRDEG